MSRRMRLGLMMTVAGLAAVGVAAVALMFLARPEFRTRWDWTRTGDAGLSERTIAALSALPEGSRATAFLLDEYPQFQLNGGAVYPRAFSLLQARLEDARIRSGGKLEIEVLDTASSLVALSEARERLGRTIGETLVWEVGGQQLAMRFEDFFEVTAATDDGAPARLRRERVDEALGDAAVRLGRERLPRVALLDGHGSAESAALSSGLIALETLMQSEGFEPVRVTSPADAGDCDLLVVPGQLRPFVPSAAAAAAAWVEAGKPVLVSIGPLAAPEVFEFWNETLAATGTQFVPGLVCQPFSTTAGLAEGTTQCANLEIPPERINGQHPVTQRLVEGQRRVVVNGGGHLETGPGSNDRLREILLRTNPDSWIEIDGDYAAGSRESRSEHTLLVASEHLVGTTGRILMFGSAWIERDPTSIPWVRDWLAPGLRWLSGEEAEFGGLVGVDARPFLLPAVLQAKLANLCVIALPGLTLLLGFLIFFSRRR